MNFVTIITLGCRTNQAESDEIGRKLQKQGVEVAFGLQKNMQDNLVGGFYIINTCAVTGVAERKSRYEVAKIVKNDPDARIIIIGCATQNDEAQFKSLNIIKVFGVDKEKVVEYILGLSERENTTSGVLYDKRNTSDNAVGDKELQARGKTKQVFVKVQDGCNNFCTFCIVPHLRGRSRSRTVSEIVAEVKGLDLGEGRLVVITGINLGVYNGGGAERVGLIELCEAVDKIGVPFRLSSLYCDVVTDEFVERLKACQNFVPRFHLSLQSGSDKVLESMNRKYTVLQFEKSVGLLRRAWAGVEISADVIVGFPTEGQDDFEGTRRLLERLKLDDLHIFPYSPRKGTIASSWSQITQHVVVERARILKKLHESIRAEKD